MHISNEETECIDFFSYVKAWLKKRSTQEADILRSLFDKVYDEIHTFVQSKLKPKMMIREALYIRQCYDVLQGLLDSEEEPRSFYFLSHLCLNTSFVFILTRGVP